MRASSSRASESASVVSAARRCATPASAASATTTHARASVVRRAKGTGADDEPVVVTLKVDGMMCEGCAESVTTLLMKNDKGVSVSAVDIDLETKMVKVSIACESVVEGVTKLPALVDVVVAGGYEAEPVF